MSTWKNLEMGADMPSGSPEEEQERIDVMCATVEEYLPEFVEAIRSGDVDILVMHQDAFAAGYHDDEFTLLGMAVKFAGLHGQGIHIIGKNGDTFSRPDA